MCALEFAAQQLMRWTIIGRGERGGRDETRRDGLRWQRRLLPSELLQGIAAALAARKMKWTAAWMILFNEALLLFHRSYSKCMKPQARMNPSPG